MKKYIILSSIAFVIFVAATIYLTFPLIFHVSDYASGEYVISWILNWDIHSILTGNIIHIFNANIFYPFPTSLAYSSPFFTSAVIGLIPFLLLKEPMVPANITFLSSLVLLGFFTYLLSYYLTKNFWASLLSGFLILFCPVTIDKRIHLQVLSIEWIPLTLLLFFHFCKTGKFTFLLLSLFFFVVQVYNDFLPGYFLVFSFIIFSLFYYFKDKKIWKRIFQWKNFFALLTAFAILLPICIPYYAVSKKYAYVRNIRDAIHFAIQPEDLLVTDGSSRLDPLLPFFKHSPNYPSYAEIHAAFPGFIFSVLSLGALIYFFRKKKKNIIFSACIVIGLLGLILAFGPALHWARRTIHFPTLIPLPYALFYYLVPGFQGLRNSARFEMLLVITFPVAISIMLTDFLKRKKIPLQIFLYTLFFAGILLEFNFPLPYVHAPTFKEFPPIYRWIAQKTPTQAVLLEVPIYNWDNNPFTNNQEALREYYATMHFRNMVNGESGFSPPQWEKLAIHMFNDFPSGTTVNEIKKLGVTYIIVHKKEYDILNAKHWQSRGHEVPNGSTVVSLLNQNPLVSFVTTIQDDYVYKIK